MQQSSLNENVGEAQGSELLPSPSFILASTDASFVATKTSRLSCLASAAPEEAERALRGSDARGVDARSLDAQRPECRMVVGALPFAPEGEARLMVCDDLTSDRRVVLRLLQQAANAESAPEARIVAEQPTPRGYTEAVKQALVAIEAGELHKAVLARSLDVALSRGASVEAMLARLTRQNPTAHVFACDVSPDDTERRVLLGASPELLVSKQGSVVTSCPLAGTKPRSLLDAMDRERANELLHCEKSRREHAFVVDAVASALTPFCKNLVVPSEPALMSTPAVWHLGSRITGTLRDPSTSSLTLARALHPTPAVCGEPAAPARALIREVEGFDRSFYAGAVGYTDAAGDGAWFVAIRCAELCGLMLRLYAGAGIVAGSQPAQELDETSAKLQTMLSALGLPDLRWVA